MNGDLPSLESVAPPEPPKPEIEFSQFFLIFVYILCAAIIMLLTLSLFLGIGYSESSVESIQAIRDDLINVCMKLGGGTSDSINRDCRMGTDDNLHVTLDCWNSGWSGQGKLKCRYGADVYFQGSNMNNAGYEQACEGCTKGRRRMEEEDDIFAEDAAGKETTEESKWEDLTHPVNFHLENIEDETEVLSLGNVAACLLQGFEYYKPDSEDVRSKCVLSKDSDGVWELAYASAKCNVICFPHGSSRYF